MRVDLVLAALAVISSAELADSAENAGKFRSSNDLPAMKPDVPACRSGFTYYKGWCVYSTQPTRLHYDDAVNTCKNLGEFSPSIHSKYDVDFWSEYAGTYPDNDQHFWLDTYCPEDGKPYVWMDGTATDYLGPHAELSNCQTDIGVHMEEIGLSSDSSTSIYNSIAPAVCVYDPLRPTTTGRPGSTARPTTRWTDPSPRSTTEPYKPLSTSIRPMTPTPTTSSFESSDCACNPSKIHLDIVFVVDTSANMPRDTVGDATATIQSTLYGLTFGTDYFESNVAALAYADSVQTVRYFGGFRTTNDITSLSFPYLGGSSNSMADAINQASSMISSNARNFTRGVIVLLTNSINQQNVVGCRWAANSFKDNGGIVITIDYSKGQVIQDLEYIASPGYRISDTVDAILYALCDANCFCRDGLIPFNLPNEIGRELPNGCYHVADSPSVYPAAAANCQNKNGFYFLPSRFWIGLTRDGDKFEWADGSNDTTTYWAAGNPVAGQDCAYAQQQTGFYSAWFSAPCTDPLKNSMTYACQIRPCDTDFDCRV